MIPVREAGGILTIDLSALAHNWKLLSARVAPGECAAVVKANAYGIGIEHAVPVLAAVGCKTFFVAVLSEAKRVRAVVRQATIYVLNGLLPGTCPIYAEYNLRPVLGSIAEIEEWRQFIAQTGFSGKAALHVDTGMNRLGLRVDEAISLNKNGQLANIDFALLMSHFVSSEEKSNPLNAQQLNQLVEVQNQIHLPYVSLCNSSGFFLELKSFLNLSRPGYALYGGNPEPGKPNSMRPVVTLEAPVVQVRDVASGETVGYNSQWTAKRPSEIAIISVGYADGISRQLSATDTKPGGIAVISGQICPFVGRISMDMITIDVTDVAGDPVQRGDLVQLLGDRISVDDMAARANTNGYEILTNLSHRYARRYIPATGH